MSNQNQGGQQIKVANKTKAASRAVRIRSPVSSSKVVSKVANRATTSPASRTRSSFF